MFNSTVKGIAFTLLFSLSAYVAVAQYISQRFERLYPSIQSGAYSIVQSPDSGYAMAGFISDSSLYYTNILLIKTDKYGNSQWMKAYSSDQDYGSGRTLVNTPDKGYMIMARVTSSAPLVSASALVILKIDSMGTIQWSKRYGIPDGSQGWGLASTSDDSYIFCGSVYSPTFDYLLMVKISSNGSIIWAKTIGETNVSAAGVTVMESSNGDFLFAGVIKGAAYIVRTDRDGNIIWKRSYDYSPSYTSARSIIEDANNNIYIAGVYNRESQSANWHPYLMKVDRDGDFTWCKVYEGPWSVSETFSIDRGHGGGVVLNIEPEGFKAGQSQFGMFKVDDEGQVEWCRIYNKDGHGFPWSVISTNDGGYAGVGHTLTYSHYPNVYFVKTDPQGLTGCNTDTLVGLNIIDTIPVVASPGIPDTLNTSYDHSLGYAFTPSLDTILCMDSIVYFLTINDPLPFEGSMSIPNIFTPNGDGVNDLFAIGLSNIEIIAFSIYNRWGVEVATGENTSPDILFTAWDGHTTSGQPASEGVYYYIIQAKDRDGKDHSRKGVVHMLR